MYGILEIIDIEGLDGKRGRRFYEGGWEGVFREVGGECGSIEV